MPSPPARRVDDYIICIKDYEAKEKQAIGYEEIVIFILD